MAKLKIWKGDIQDGRLPPVCVVCGSEADATKTVNFHWNPSWVILLLLFGLLPVVLGYLLTKKSMTVPLPVCERHRRRWSVRWIILGSWMTVAIGLGCLGAYVLAHGDKTLGENIMVSAAGLLVLAAIAIMFLGDGRVHPNEITDQTITLTGLSDAFVQAMEQGHTGSVPSQGVALQTAKYYRGGYGRDGGY
jgi:hypothetical protein